MVLDTNTLLEHVVFIWQIFPLLLVRNLSALLISNVWPESGIIPPLRSAGRVQTFDLPFRIALPHIVLRALDGLNAGGRSDSVRIAAQQANRWILAYPQGQKRSASTFLSKGAIEMVMRAAIAAGGAATDVTAAAEATTAALIPPEAWGTPLRDDTAAQGEDEGGSTGEGEAELMTNRLWILPVARGFDVVTGLAALERQAGGQSVAFIDLHRRERLRLPPVQLRSAVLLPHPSLPSARRSSQV